MIERAREKLAILDSKEKFIVNVSKISGKTYFHKLAEFELHRGTTRQRGEKLNRTSP